MNKVRAAYKRLDYNNGDFLAHYQWRVMQDSVMFVWKVLQDDEDGLLLDDIKIKAVDFATNVVSKVGTSTNKMMENISMQIRDKVDEFSQILGKNMETIQQYYAICSLTIKRLPLVAPYLETVVRETVLENIPLFSYYVFNLSNDCV